MLDTVKELFGSKKFLAFLTTALVVVGNKVVGHFGYELDASQVALIVATGSSYIIGQGIADHGSTAAQIKADGPVAGPAVTNTVEVGK